VLVGGRRLLSAPLIKSSIDEPAAAAAAVHSPDAVLSDEFPSPASSAAEALEMESVSFGQDAADLLNENSSSAGCHG